MCWMTALLCGQPKKAHGFQVLQTCSLLTEEEKKTCNEQLEKTKDWVVWCKSNTKIDDTTSATRQGKVVFCSKKATKETAEKERFDLHFVYWFFYRNRCKTFRFYISGLPLEFGCV